MRFAYISVMITDKSSPIGFYDSGVGGITVLDTAMEAMPHEDYVYLADCSHAPYGCRGSDEILGRAMFCTGKLISDGAKAVVVACNTATAVAVDALRKAYGAIIIGAEPAIKPACKSGAKNILVLVTPLTAVQDRFLRLVHAYPDKNITVVPAEGLASSIEKHIDNTEAVRNEVYALLSRYSVPDAVVLGCTHYVHIARLIKDYYGAGVRVYDGNKGIVDRLHNELSSAGLLNVMGGRVRFVTA